VDTRRTDPLLVWAARGERVWARGDAVVIACPGLSGRDRLIVHGGVESAVRLIREALAEVGPTYRRLGDEATIEAVVERG
jgi:hypothetical protein